MIHQLGTSIPVAKISLKTKLACVQKLSIGFVMKKLRKEKKERD